MTRAHWLQGPWRRHLWWVFALLVLTLFLGTRGLNEPDEGRYAEIGREMATGGDWLVPTLNGFEHFQKPPLLYWMTAASLRLFGCNEWAARVPPAIAAFGTVLLTFAIGRRLFGEAAGEAAAVILVSGVEFFMLGRSLTPDMVLAFWIVAAIAAFLYGKPRLFFIAMGLGFMTKGPMALVVPLCAVLCWQKAAKGTLLQRKLPWGEGVVWTVAISLSWFVVLSVSRPALFEYFWKYELLERFATHRHGRSQPFWFFGPVLLVALLPWTFFLGRPLRAAWAAWRERRLAPCHALLLGWTLIPFIILSISGSKLVTYVLPLLPAFALGLGAHLSRYRPGVVWKIALPTALLWLAVMGNAAWVEAYLGRQTPTKPLAAMILAHPQYADAVVFTCGVRTHGFEFYLGRTVATTLNEADIVLPVDAAGKARLFKNPAELAKQLENRPAIGLISQKAFGPLFSEPRWRVIDRAGDFLLIASRPGAAARY